MVVYTSENIHKVIGKRGKDILQCHPPNNGKFYPTQVINRIRINVCYYSLAKTNNSGT